jgi:hypothetical protein
MCLDVVPSLCRSPPYSLNVVCMHFKIAHCFWQGFGSALIWAAGSGSALNQCGSETLVFDHFISPWAMSQASSTRKLNERFLFLALWALWASYNCEEEVVEAGQPGKKTVISVRTHPGTSYLQSARLFLQSSVLEFPPPHNPSPFGL